jgi:hypothetical protein
MTQLATPYALVMLAGLALAYVALRGWDRKYGLLQHSIA